MFHLNFICHSSQFSFPLKKFSGKYWKYRKSKTILLWRRIICFVSIYKMRKRKVLENWNEIERWELYFYFLITCDFRAAPHFVIVLFAMRRIYLDQFGLDSQNETSIPIERRLWRVFWAKATRVYNKIKGISCVSVQPSVSGDAAVASYTSPCMSLNRKSLSERMFPKFFLLSPNKCVKKHT